MLKTENGRVLWSPEKPGLHTVTLRGAGAGGEHRRTIYVVEPPPGWDPASGVPPRTPGEPRADVRAVLGGPPVPVLESNSQFCIA
ncbi:hypothetical protein [Alienimonas sp. DA493]|uniref:hypothetical protein n=1 Tax=Alienimonas sp. DA493 TaxID=3373605 RepID=UPI0037543959